MKESILKNYFKSDISAFELTEDLKGSQEPTGHDTTSVTVERLHVGEFEIEKQHLVRLCEDYLSDQISNENLNVIGFILIFSDYFVWDSETKSGEVISQVIFDWDNEDIGFDITKKNVGLWKQYLENGHYNFDHYELELKFRSNGKFLKLYRSIDEILRIEWDPLGVSSFVWDEYQSYTPDIFKLRRSKASVKEIENELYRIERDVMGLNGNRGNCNNVASIINRLNE